MHYIIIIGAMDSFARGLRNAVELAQQGVMAQCVKVTQVYFALLSAELVIIYLCYLHAKVLMYKMYTLGQHHPVNYLFLYIHYINIGALLII